MLDAMKCFKSKFSIITYVIIPLFVFMFSFEMQRNVALIGLDLHHDLLIFNAARQTLNGSIPYRDFFYQYNLATVFFHVAALKLGGVYIASLKVATAYIYSLIALLIYIISAILGKVKIGLLFAILWSLLSPFYMPALNGYHAWSTVYMMASIMFGLLFLMITIKHENFIYSFIAGCFFSLAFWFKQVAAIQIILVIIWFLIEYPIFRKLTNEYLRNLKILLGFALGGCIVAACFLLYINHNSAFGVWYQCAFEFNRLFVATSNSNSSGFSFIKNILPVTKGLGYVSFIWAILPVYITYKIFRLFQLNCSSRPNPRDKKITLLLTLAIAGWVEYLPLAHEFHTHLFMAPVFCYLVLDLCEFKWTRSQWKSIAIFTFMAFVLTYESAAHIYGFYKKNTQDLIEVEDNSPVKGLRLGPDNYIEFMDFQRKMLVLSGVGYENQFLPLSVDPLEAILPISAIKPFSKMGVNWTWANELVEPGFNKKLANKLILHKNPIYADTLLALPGYIPESLLEMISPLGSFHSIYKPAKSSLFLGDVFMEGVSLLKVEAEFSELNLRRGSELSRESRGSHKYYQLLGSNNQVKIDLNNIKDIHVISISVDEFPQKLDKYQYELYLKKSSLLFDAAEVLRFYSKNSGGNWVLKSNLTSNENLMLGKYLLQTGKLMEKRDRPYFSSTLTKDIGMQPVILGGVIKKEIIWAYYIKVDTKLNQENLSIAIPFRDEMKSSQIHYVQIVMNDDSSIDWFVNINN